MANETDNLNPPTVDQRCGRGRLLTWVEDRAQNNNRAAGAEGRCELLEANQALIEQRLAAIEGHLQALHVARAKAGPA